jgi:hypothetical protein
MQKKFVGLAPLQMLSFGEFWKKSIQKAEFLD